jgi:hypothetical protein
VPLSHAIIVAMDGASIPGEEPPTGEQFTTAASDRCSNCQAPLASDQRYCINCGERRGKPRFTFAADQAEPATASAPKQPRQGGRSNGAVALVGFIAVLLLAMGVGVLIGHSNNNNNTATKVASTPAPEVITVGGSGTTASTSNSSTSKSSKKKKSSSGSSSSSKSKVSKSAATAAANAAGNAYGGGSSKISDPTVQPGQAATGPGTQNGKFTGNFFP